MSAGHLLADEENEPGPKREKRERESVFPTLRGDNYGVGRERKVFLKRREKIGF